MKRQHTWLTVAGNFEIGRILHLKSEIRNSKLDCRERKFA